MRLFALVNVSCLLRSGCSQFSIRDSHCHLTQTAQPAMTIWALDLNSSLIKLGSHKMVEDQMLSSFGVLSFIGSWSVVTAPVPWSLEPNSRIMQLETSSSVTGSLVTSFAHQKKEPCYRNQSCTPPPPAPRKSDPPPTSEPPNTGRTEAPKEPNRACRQGQNCQPRPAAPRRDNLPASSPD